MKSILRAAWIPARTIYTLPHKKKKNQGTRKTLNRERCLKRKARNIHGPHYLLTFESKYFEIKKRGESEPSPADV